MIPKRFAAISKATAAGLVILGLLDALQLHAQSTQSSSAPAPSFEVASVKPNHSGDPRNMMMFSRGGFRATGTTAKNLIALAYRVKDFQITGGPNWIGSEKFDVEAKEPDSLAEELQKLPPEQSMEKTGLMIQSLLADRFKLKVSHETKELPVFALVVAKNGPKLQEAKPGDTYPNGIKGLDRVAHPGMMRMGRGQLTGQAIPIGNLVMLLSQQLGRNVLDQTGLKGKYDITLQWTPDPGEGAMIPGPPGAGPGGAAPPPPPDPSGPSIFTALQEQLGLKLESTKGPVDIIVVDHVEPPSED